VTEDLNIDGFKETLKKMISVDRNLFMSSQCESKTDTYVAPADGVNGTFYTSYYT